MPSRGGGGGPHQPGRVIGTRRVRQLAADDDPDRKLVVTALADPVLSRSRERPAAEGDAVRPGNLSLET